MPIDFPSQLGVQRSSESAGTVKLEVRSITVTLDHWQSNDPRRSAAIVAGIRERKELKSSDGVFQLRSINEPIDRTAATRDFRGFNDLRFKQ